MSTNEELAKRLQVAKVHVRKMKGQVNAMSKRLVEHVAFDLSLKLKNIVVHRSTWNAWRDALNKPIKNEPLPQEMINKFMALTEVRGECWIWTRPLKDRTQPQHHIDGVCYTVRRELMRFHGLEEDNADRNCMIAPTCGAYACVNPKHMKTFSMKEHMANLRPVIAKKIATTKARKKSNPKA